MTDCLILESEGGVVHLTLNRPEKRNALSFELLTQLEAGDCANRGRRASASGCSRVTWAGLLLGA